MVSEGVEGLSDDDDESVKDGSDDVDSQEYDYMSDHTIA